jgi:peptidyl-prolyl cis-trans isomerase C
MMRYSLLVAAALYGATMAGPGAAFAQTESPAANPAQVEGAPSAEAGADAATPGEDRVIATVGDVEVYESELAFALSDLDPQFGQLPVEQRRVAALSALLDIKLLSARADAAGLADGEAFQKRMAFLRDRALHNAYFQDEVLGGIEDADVRARYDAEVEATEPAEEVNARHILVETEEQATALIAELDGGADFAELAQANSSDGSSANGGDLGYFQRGQMVPPFEEAAFALEVGSHTATPVQSQFGWHVIKVEDKRAAEPPAFEQVEEQVRQVVLRERYLAELEEAREETTVEIVDEELRTAYDAVNQ